MINTYTILILLSFLSACASEKPPPVYVPYASKVPVTSSCIRNVPEEPIWNSDLLSANASPVLKLKALLEDNALSRSYIKELNAVIVACK